MNKESYYKYLRKKHLRDQCDRLTGKKKLKPMRPTVVFLLTFLGCLVTVAVFSFIVNLFL